MVKLLKEMLYLEAKDKEFLLTNITRVTQGKGITYYEIKLSNPIQPTKKIYNFSYRLDF